MLAIAAVLIEARPAMAVGRVCTWLGQGIDFGWNTPGNWQNCVVPDDDIVVFAGGTKATSFQNIDGLKLRAIRILGVANLPPPEGRVAFTIVGLEVTLTGALEVSAPRDDAGRGPALQLPITLGDRSSISNTANIQPGGPAPLTITGAVDLRGFELKLEGNVPINIDGPIKGNGLITSANDFVRLRGDSSFTGVLRLTHGTVAVFHDRALGAAGAGNETFVNFDAHLEVLGDLTIDEALVLDVAGPTDVPPRALIIAAPNGATLRGPILASNGTIQVDPAATATLAGVVSGSLVTTGFGTLALTNRNLFTRLVCHESSRVTVRGPGGIPNGATVTMLTTPGGAGTMLDLNGFDASIGSLSGPAAPALILLGAGTLTIDQRVDGTFNGTIDGAGHVVKNGNAQLAFGGLFENAYTGTTTVNAGVLVLGKQDPAIRGPVVVNGGILRTLTSSQFRGANTSVTINSPGAFDLADTVQDISSLAGNGSVGLGLGSLTVADGDTTPATVFDGRIHGDRPGVLGFAVTFNNAITLTGHSTYLGATIVKERLAINGSLHPSSFVQVTPGSTLAGSGTIGEANIDSGILAPGTSPGQGILRTASLNMQGTLQVALNGLTAGAGYNQVAVDGDLVLDDGDSSLSVTLGFKPRRGASFTIVDISAGHTVTGPGAAFIGLPEGETFAIGDRKARITYRGGDGNDVVLTIVDDLPALTYHLSEGATGGFFDEDVLIANPSTDVAPITLTFSKETGEQVVVTREVPAQGHLTVHVDALAGLEETAASVQVSSDTGVPLIVERSMFWDARYYAGHTGSAVSDPAQDWFFAEGSQGFFRTFVLAINPNPTATDVTFTFLREDEAPVVRTIPLGPSTRLTLFAGDMPELDGRSFGIAVHATQPIMAERSMYFGPTATRAFSGGTESAGVTAASTRWFLAEGATGGFFDTFVLLSNPQATPAHVELKYLLDTGEPVTMQKTIAANARLTTNIEAEDDPRLRDAAVSTVVTSDVPIIAERSMYWPGPPGSDAAMPWGEGHNSFGVVDAATTWGLAEGRIGGPLNFHTFILLANPQATAANVTVTYLRENGAAPVVLTYAVPPASRFNIDTGGVAGLQNESFGALIQVTNAVPIIVERSIYWDPTGGPAFAGGTNATGIRLP